MKFINIAAQAEAEEEMARKKEPRVRLGLTSDEGRVEEMRAIMGQEGGERKKRPFSIIISSKRKISLYFHSDEDNYSYTFALPPWSHTFSSKIRGSASRIGPPNYPKRGEN